MGGGPVPVMLYPSLVDDAGNVPVRGGGPVPVNVNVDVELDAIAGDGVEESGYNPFKGGGPVPLKVYVATDFGPGRLDDDDNVVM
jgi:hypothetical protein